MTAYYAKLESEALLHISGPDTLAFLQGQTTCDTRIVDVDHAVPGAYCTPQGRMVCDFILAQLAPEHFALRMRADTLDNAAATYGKYIVFSKADLDAQREDWQVVACWGDTAAEIIETLVGQRPDSQFSVVSGDGYALIQLDERGEQFEAWIDMERHSDHFHALQQAMTAGSENDWQALQIHAGFGRVEGPTVEEFLPQMLNYDITGHISFNKGCYTGQEIVARLHYRGKAKRRMYLATSDGTSLPAGTPLFTAGKDQAIGSIVNGALDGDQAVYLVSSTEAGLAGPLHPESPDSQLALLLSSVHEFSDE